MSIETGKNEHGHGSFERRDIGVDGIIYFFAGLAAATLVILFMLMGLFIGFMLIRKIVDIEV